ncbi:uncharacterized protein N7506_010318 [Penicillium brevicompactum]|uniref:uncharacterized protein n=1 Tax=Penicillium brevicompactum TaxID=5074 RepID=UPI002540926A|nr:uncharacterized protein N7506_010318 [Penicillium brevicompactum]KAJ5327216.1 hypothetical protein N7506_010318 [Penicillium brevicompactum]
MARSLRSKRDSVYLKWSAVMHPSEALHELLGDRDNSRLFFHGLRRQVKAIRQRSQKSEDGQITIFDAALVRLYDNGHTMQSYGLFEFYMAEFLGTKDCVSDGEIKACLAANLAAQRVLDAGPISEIPTLSNLTAGEEEIKSTDHDNASTQATDSTRDSEDSKPRHLDRLVETYQKAKEDYYVLEVTETHDKKTNSVRFLRDTAENLLRYLKNVDKDHDLIQELEDTVKSSKAHADKLAGGRKRKFEREDSSFHGSPSPSPYRPYGYYGETYGEVTETIAGTDMYQRLDGTTAGVLTPTAPKSSLLGALFIENRRSDSGGRCFVFLLVLQRKPQTDLPVA